MILKHKIFVLTDAKGEPAEVSSAKNLIFVINDTPASRIISDTESDPSDIIQEADMLEDNILEGYSILSSFAVKDGELRYDQIRIHLYDTVKKTDIFIKEVKNPPLLMEKIGTIDLDNKEVKRQMAFISSFVTNQPEQEDQQEEISQEEEQAPSELADDIEPAPVQTEEAPIPSDEVPAVTDTPDALPDTTEPVISDTPSVTAEDTQSPAQSDTDTGNNKESDLNLNQLEENVIPKAVLDKYEGYRKDLIEEGFREYAYKNYRFFEMPSDDPDKRGMDVLLLLLTPERVGQIRPLQIIDAGNILKYKFEIDGVKKTISANTDTMEMTIRRIKRGEKPSDAISVDDTEESADNKTDDTPAPVNNDTAVDTELKDESIQADETGNKDA